MERKRIYLYTMGDILNFIRNTSKVEGKVSCYSGNSEKDNSITYCIDGKSLLGVLSLDTVNGIIVEYPKEDENFKKYLKDLK